MYIHCILMKQLKQLRQEYWSINRTSHCLQANLVVSLVHTLCEEYFLFIQTKCSNDGGKVFKCPLIQLYRQFEKQKHDKV